MNNVDIFYQAGLTRRLARNARAELFLQRLTAGDTQPVAWQHVNLDDDVNYLEDQADKAEAKAKVLEVFKELPEPKRVSGVTIVEESVEDDIGSYEFDPFTSGPSGDFNPGF